MIYNFRTTTFESLFPTQAFIFLEENLFFFIIFVLKTGNSRFSKWHDFFQNIDFWFELLSKMYIAKRRTLLITVSLNSLIMGIWEYKIMFE